MMLSIFLVASFVLPGALACCLPDKYSVLQYEVGKKGFDYVLFDFKGKKNIVRPSSGDTEFRLTDFGAGVGYTKYRDGSCVSYKSRTVFPQCIMAEAKYVSTSVLGGSLLVDDYAAEGYTTTLTQDCVPVFMMLAPNEEQPKIVIILANFTSTPDISELNQDVSNCESDGML